MVLVPEESEIPEIASRVLVVPSGRFVVSGTSHNG
jgi:hypothetical protein